LFSIIDNIPPKIIHYAGTLSLLNDPYLAGAGVFSTPSRGTARLLNMAEDLKALLSPLTTEGVIN